MSNRNGNFPKDSLCDRHGCSKTHPIDVSDEEWALISSYLELMPEASCQRRHASRDVFNALRYMVRSGIQRRMLPHDFPPWEAVYQQSRRWLAAGCSIA